MVFSFNIHIKQFGDIDFPPKKKYHATVLQFFMMTPNNLDEMIDRVKQQLEICEDSEQQYFYFDREFHYSFSEKNKEVIRQFYYDFLDECNDTNKGNVLGIGMYYFMPIDENNLIELINHDAHINKDVSDSEITETYINAYYTITRELNKEYHKYILYLTNMTIRINLCTYHRIRGRVYNDTGIRNNEFNYMGYIPQGLLQ